MKISQNAERCGLSPMRKFHPLAVAAEQRGLKIYHLNIGQPDLPTPQSFYDAVRNFHVPTVAYAPSPGIPELIDAIQNYYAGIRVNLDKSDILITTGGSEALQMLFLCILDPGSEVIIPEPFYPNYATFIKALGGNIRPLTTSPATGYHFPSEDALEALVNENTRAILLSNPGNPTGVILTKEEMDMVAAFAKKHDLYLIADEVYREFCYADGAEIPTFGRYADIADNLVIIDSVSKRFSACGARIGCMITKNKALQQAAIKFCQARLSVATLDQVGAVGLYGPGFDFDASRKEYRRRRDTVVEKLRKVEGIQFSVPEGAFYLMAALPVDDTDKFQKWLLTEFQDNNETVMFAPGAPFYATPGVGANEIRIAYILKQQDLERAMDLLVMGIHAYNHR